MIPAAPWRVKALSVLPAHRLAVAFNDGTRGIADRSGIATADDGGTERSPADPEVFAQAGPARGAVAWPSGAHLHPAWMRERITENKAWIVPCSSAAGTQEGQRRLARRLG